MFGNCGRAKTHSEIIFKNVIQKNRLLFPYYMTTRSCKPTPPTLHVRKLWPCENEWEDTIKKNHKKTYSFLRTLLQHVLASRLRRHQMIGNYGRAKTNGKITLKKITKKYTHFSVLCDNTFLRADSATIKCSEIVAVRKRVRVCVVEPSICVCMKMNFFLFFFWILYRPLVCTSIYICMYIHIDAYIHTYMFTWLHI